MSQPSQEMFVSSQGVEVESSSYENSNGDIEESGFATPAGRGRKTRIEESALSDDDVEEETQELGASNATTDGDDDEEDNETRDENKSNDETRNDHATRNESRDSEHHSTRDQFEQTNATRDVIEQSNVSRNDEQSNSITDESGSEEDHDLLPAEEEVPASTTSHKTGKAEERLLAHPAGSSSSAAPASRKVGPQTKRPEPTITTAAPKRPPVASKAISMKQPPVASKAISMKQPPKTSGRKAKAASKVKLPTTVVPPEPEASASQDLNDIFSGAERTTERKSSKKSSKRKQMEQQYVLYIHKVHREINPDLTMSTKTMSVLNSFVGDMFERFSTEAAILAKLNKHKTLGAREIETAVRLVLGTCGTSLAEHACAEGTKALALYNRSRDAESKK